MARFSSLWDWSPFHRGNLAADQENISVYGLFQIRGRFVMGGIERFRGQGVKASMDLARIVICSLLPALWVLAAGQCLADTVCGCSDGCGRTLVSATKDGGQAPLPDARSFEQSVRLSGRRMGMQTGWDDFSVPVPGSLSGLAELEPVSAPLAVSTDAPGLAQCWQFYWRTAAEPRAPSSVS